MQGLDEVRERWEAEEVRYREEGALVNAVHLVGRFLADLDALRLSTANPPDSAWLTTAHIATRFRVTGATVRTWCAAGRFDGAIRLDNGTWRIPPAAADAFAAARRA